jgi:hypothetical protein
LRRLNATPYVAPNISGRTSPIDRRRPPTSYSPEQHGGRRSRPGRSGSPSGSEANRAKVALARKLAVILHRIWIDDTTFS